MFVLKQSNSGLVTRGFIYLSASESWCFTHWIYFQNYHAELKITVAFEVFTPLTLIEERHNRDRKSPHVICIRVQFEVLKFVLKETRGQVRKLTEAEGRDPLEFVMMGWWWALSAHGGEQRRQHRVRSRKTDNSFPFLFLSFPIPVGTGFLRPCPDQGWPFCQ